ncbi:MAG: hypothetical protein EZS28_016046 [Streblomastix strix]|uniref:Uncharacterized protein n=1 Tax=Streblomastix strix TaxID=222440 RepID=A0A5J4W1T6_9EUKA|nr:MAG: hypothetical protein EZS28_016046 [Streblomastix strix]
MTMKIDVALSGLGSTLEKELEMIAMTHEIWNKRYAKFTGNSMEIKAVTQSLRSFAKVLKNSRIQSLAIRSDNSSAVFNFRKWNVSISLIKEIKQVHKTIKKLEIQIQVTHIPGVKKRDCKRTKQIIKSRRLQTKGEDFSIDMSSDELEPNIRPILTTLQQLTAIFMSTIRAHEEIAIDALNQVWKIEFSWTHPLIPLLQAVLKKIREEQIEAKIIAPLQLGQVWQTELVNENVQSLMLGWSNEIQEPGISLIKKKLILHPGKICCFLMDRRPGKEEDSQQEFQEQQIYPRQQQI